MSDRLEHLLRAARDRLAERVARVSLEELRERATAVEERRPFGEALAGPGISLIAEHKRRSPSVGVIRDGARIEDVVAAYERGGAAALSVLTDEDHFGGRLDDLTRARSASGLPILRKDFVVDPYQLHEARAAGADAVLLIVGAVDEGALADLHAEAHAIDLDVLVEVHTEADLEVALAIGADVIGINNRDLEDFSVDLARTFELLPEIPTGKTVVAESGILERRQVEELESVGLDAVLVGESLMRADDPEAAAAALLHEHGGGASESQDR